MKTGIPRFNSKFEVFLPGVPETISVYHKGAHLTNETDIFSGTSLRTVRIPGITNFIIVSVFIPYTQLLKILFQSLVMWL